MDRLARKTEEIERMDAKIMISLETEEDIKKDTDIRGDTALSFQNTISYCITKMITTCSPLTSVLV